MGTNQEMSKSRFVVQEHTDQQKNMLVHTSTNIKKQTIRLLISLTALFGFRLWSQGVSQAYLQSASKLTRDVFVQHRQGFKIEPNEILSLLKPLNGLTDSGDYWDMKMNNRLKEDLQMKPLIGDLPCFIKIMQGKLKEITGVYVDNTLAAGNDEFLQDSKLTEQKLKSKSN